MTATKPPTLSQAVATKIREQILNREIAGGAPLRQDAIAKAFGSSIIPVREALRQLESEGLVELHPRRGALATSLTLDKALDWIHLRRIIESDLISQAIDRMSDEVIRSAEQILRDFESKLNAHLEVDHWSQANWAFHAALYAPAGRDETLKILEALHLKCDRYHRLQLLGADHKARANAEHWELIELCRARDKRSARALMRKHIIGVEEDLREIFDN
ncbi:MAG: GntR family transcriptional regulator [Halieaceae bacterium]|nr:GntR family transcriptional regulator [Halieaceae bacterium]